MELAKARGGFETAHGPLAVVFAGDYECRALEHPLEFRTSFARLLT